MVAMVIMVMVIMAGHHGDDNDALGGLNGQQTCVTSPCEGGPAIPCVRPSPCEGSRRTLFERPVISQRAGTFVSQAAPKRPEQHISNSCGWSNITCKPKLACDGQRPICNEHDVTAQYHSIQNHSKELDSENCFDKYGRIIHCARRSA